MQTTCLPKCRKCKTIDQEYVVRSKIRAEDVVVLSEAIEILTGDDARELFGRSVGASIIQTDMSVSAQDGVTDMAMQKLMPRKKSNTVALMSLAVRAKLDAFDKVKETMGNMLAELKPQQKTEYDQNERCKKHIDETEGTIKIEQRKKKDFEDKSKDSTNILATLNGDIKTLKQEASDIEASLNHRPQGRQQIVPECNHHHPELCT